MADQYYVFIYRPGRKWLPGRSIQAQPLESHFAYMAQLEQGGALCLGGPFTDDAGAAGIIRAADAAAAQAIVDADPAISDGVMTAELHPWYPSVLGTITAL